GAWTCGARPRRRAAGGGGPVDPRRVPRGGDGGKPRPAQRPRTGAAAHFPRSSITRADGRVAALVLAAGALRPLGADTLRAPLDGRPVLARCLGVAEAVLQGRVTLVLGAHGDNHAPRADGARVIRHPRWAEGLSSSTAARVASL